jgi:hypothetical protein
VKGQAEAPEADQDAATTIPPDSDRFDPIEQIPFASARTGEDARENKELEPIP